MGAGRRSPKQINIFANFYSFSGRWAVNDIGCLARLIAIVTVGQAMHAAKIIAELSKPTPAFNNGFSLQWRRCNLRPPKPNSFF